MFSITSHKHRRKYALMRNDLTEEDWNWLLDQVNHRCTKCREPFSEENKPTIDHVYSDEHGLIDGTTLRNVQPLCASCNSRKGNRHTKDFRSEAVRRSIWKRILKRNKSIFRAEKTETANMLFHLWFNSERLYRAYRHYRESSLYRPVGAERCD